MIEGIITGSGQRFAEQLLRENAIKFYTDGAANTYHEPFPPRRSM